MKLKHLGLCWSVNLYVKVETNTKIFKLECSLGDVKLLSCPSITYFIFCVSYLETTASSWVRVTLVSTEFELKSDPLWLAGLPPTHKSIWCVPSSLLLVKSPFFALSEHLIGSDVEQSWSGQGAKKSTWYSFLWRTTYCFCVKSEAALQFPHYHDTKYQVVTK